MMIVYTTAFLTSTRYKPTTLDSYFSFREDLSEESTLPTYIYLFQLREDLGERNIKCKNVYCIPCITILIIIIIIIIIFFLHCEKMHRPVPECDIHVLFIFTIWLSSVLKLRTGFITPRISLKGSASSILRTISIA